MAGLMSLLLVTSSRVLWGVFLIWKLLVTIKEKGPGVVSDPHTCLHLHVIALDSPELPIQWVTLADKDIPPPLGGLDP